MLRPGTLLFAYGSLMDPACLRAVTGVDPEPGYAARVEGWRLAFSVREPDGSWVAALSPAEGCVTYGAVYRIPGSVLKALDRFEGVPEPYRRSSLWVEPVGRPARQAVVAYISAPDTPARGTRLRGTPRPAYLDTIIRGARAHGLPEAYIDWIRAEARGVAAGCYAEDAIS